MSAPLAEARAMDRASSRSLLSMRRGTYADTQLHLTDDERALFVVRLRDAMAKRAMSAGALARLLGLRKATVAWWLGGYHAPKAGRMGEVAKALGCSADWLAAASDEPCWKAPTGREGAT